MYNKKQNFFKTCIIISVSFIIGITSTVLAAVVYDTNIENRSNRIFDIIKSNASNMNPSNRVSYYSLVRMNIESLIEVLTIVDSKIATELGGITNNTGTTTNTGTTSFSCLTRPSYLTANNATFVAGTPTTLAGQTWQNTSSSSSCYYTCKTGYSGSQCIAIVATLSCLTRPSYLTTTNTIFVDGTPTTTAQQTWQNTSSSSSCYYSCKTGYSGAQCTQTVQTCQEGFLKFPNNPNSCYDTRNCSSWSGYSCMNTSGTPTCPTGYHIVTGKNYCTENQPGGGYACNVKPTYLTPNNANFVDGTPTTTAGQNWQNTSSSSSCYYTCKTGFSGNQCTATTDTNTNGYLVARQYAGKFCMAKFYSDGFATIKQNIPKAIQSNCTSGRCLVSKFYWVAGGVTVIHEDREDYWEQNNGMIDNIKCSTDNGTNTDVVRYNPSVKNQCQGIKDNGTQDYVTLDSNNQVSKVIKTCIKPLNGGLSCNEGRGGCCPDGQVSINTECVPQSEEGGYCYADSQCKPGLDCNNHSCHKDTTTYSWVENISSCRSDGETEFGGKKTKNFSCKGSNGMVDYNGSKCTGTKPADEEIVCTMTTSAARYSGFIFKYPIPFIMGSYSYYGPIYEGATLSISEATVDKCIGTNCTKVDVPRLDIDWAINVSEEQTSGNNGISGQDTNWITKWNKLFMYINTKNDNIGGGTSKTGDLVTYDYGDSFSSRKITVSGKIKDLTKYPSNNLLKHDFNIDMKNKFDAKLTKTQPLFQGYGVSRIFIELLGEDGYAEPGNAGLYYYNGACGVTSSNSTVTPTIEFLGVNNEPLSTSANSLPGSRFKVNGLENAPTGTKIDILCTLINPQQGTTRTITLSETK